MRLTLAIALLVLGCGFGAAQGFTVPNTFASGRVISASEMNPNFI